MKIRDNKQSKLRTVIMICFLFMSFALAHAQQPYKFKTEEQSGLFICTTKGEGYGVNENSFCGDFKLGSAKDSSVGLIWGLFPKDKDTGIELFFLDEKGITIKFQLSNGEVFETNNPERTGKLYWFGANSISFKSNKTLKQNTFEAGSYFIGQLRKYNITKISILDKANHRVELATNGFRSAITIDAMCKTLMAKTGDQGQYGSRSSASSTSKRPENSAPNNNNTKPSSYNNNSFKNCPDDKHPHVIDLGLPSGTKWACCNVGANKPEDFGGYYAWGETKEKKNYFAWDTYIHCNGSESTCHNLGSDIAGTGYDVAHVKWGDSWVMPSFDQIMELLENCTYEWTTVNGINGGKLTSKTNGGTIFLPAAGYINVQFVEPSSVGTIGGFWSGTLHPRFSYDAYTVGFHSRKVSCDNYYRCSGYPVRPVYK